MKRPGRPALKMTHGQKLAQTFAIVQTFDEAREAGEKWAVAISMAAEVARRRYPSLSVSNSEVKRVVSKWRGKSCTTVFLLRDEVPQHQTLILPSTSDPETLKAAEELVRCLGRSARSTVGYIGAKPVVERHNRAKKPRNRKKPKP